MIATDFPTQTQRGERDAAIQAPEPEADRPNCYALTIFTNRWKEIRDFYVQILDAKVISERPDRYCEMELCGIPLCVRRSESGEMVSYFHLYLSLKNREPILKELRNRGILATSVGPYTNFRDPEGRVIKLSETKTAVA
jgi:hypothetical protein